MRAWFCRRVVVLGAESTGTTTLSRALADHDGTAWVRFREVLAAQEVPWLEVRGSRDERLTTAVAAVDALLANGWNLADPLG